MNLCSRVIPRELSKGIGKSTQNFFEELKHKMLFIARESYQYPLAKVLFIGLVSKLSRLTRQEIVIDTVVPWGFSLHPHFVHAV